MRRQMWIHERAGRGHEVEAGVEHVDVIVVEVRGVEKITGLRLRHRQSLVDGAVSRD